MCRTDPVSYTHLEGPPGQRLLISSGTGVAGVLKDVEQRVLLLGEGGAEGLRGGGFPVQSQVVAAGEEGGGVVLQVIEQNREIVLHGKSPHKWI